MTRQQRRTQIIQACLEQQQELAATARQEMESAQQQSNDYGAIVVTNRQRFFLSIGAGKFLVPHRSAESVPQETYFAISAQTPIYMALKGKKAGDSITFNGTTQTITEIL